MYFKDEEKRLYSLIMNFMILWDIYAEHLLIIEENIKENDMSRKSFSINEVDVIKCGEDSIIPRRIEYSLSIVIIRRKWYSRNNIQFKRIILTSRGSSHATKKIWRKWCTSKSIYTYLFLCILKANSLKIRMIHEIVETYRLICDTSSPNIPT